ncbi:MAG: acyl-CoA dehydratase activase-related protein [Thermodesulfovibrionales bacterium]
MNMRIGLPRALLYYRYGAFWRRLLEEAGCEIITSPETTGEIIAAGLRKSVGDLCLPVKAFLGHVESLKDSVDVLFVPRYVSDEPDAYLCPKIIGLPDVVRACFTHLPPVASPLLHVRRDGDAALTAFCRETSRALGLKPGLIESACRTACAAPPAGPELPSARSAHRVRIGVIGRDYLVFDRAIGRKVLRTLDDLGATPVWLRPDEADVREAMTVIPKWVYWSMGREVVASAHAFFRDRGISGVINVCSAACGPDSFTGDLIRKRLNAGNKPYLSLSFDEHSSDVGMQTRIEAFIDMLLKVTA